MENKLTTLVLAIRFDSAFYKTFRFEGVDHARQMIGENNTIRVYANHDEYVFEHPTTAEHITHRKSELDYRNIKDAPFAVIYQYGTGYVQLDESKTFAFGAFNGYAGQGELRWEVLSTNELNQFITLDEAEDALHGK